MVGKFLLGMVSGGLLVTGGLVIGSALFPVAPANDNAPSAVAEPVVAPAATAADAGPAVTEEPVSAAEAQVDLAEAAAESAEVESAGVEASDTPPAPTTDVEVAPDTPVETAPEAATVAEVPAETASASDAAAEAPVTDAKPAVETTAAAPEAATTEAPEPAALAAEVAAPETSAEPSKPAETLADAAPEAPAETALAESAAVADVANPAAEPATAEVVPTEPAAEPVPVEPAAAPEIVPEPEPEIETAEAETVREPDAPETTLVEAAPAATEVVPTVEPEVEATAPAAEDTVIAELAPEPEAPVLEAPAPEAMPAELTPVEPIPAEPMPAEPAVIEAPEVTEDPAPVEAMPSPDADAAPTDAATEAAQPAMPGTRPAPLPGETAEPEAEARSSTFKPAPGLPRASETAEAPATDPAATDPAAAPLDPRPLAQFAATFENPDAKPPFAIVLIDDGSAGLDRAGLAALPFPVSFALNPLDPASAQHAATYRAAGKEVVMLVTGIAEGAMPADVEVAFQSMEQGLPEAVAVMDLPVPSFQNRRPLAATVVPILKAQGRGLLTWDAGLNAADQVARREDLEAGVIFRDIGSTGADAAAIRRLLDRAVFKAGQDGRVSVVGTADPTTVAALLEWTVEGKAATVALAPVTAVLTVE